MKLRKIAGLCKRNKCIMILNEYMQDSEMIKRQFVSDGHAIYPIDGLPELDENAVMTLFDIPQKDRDMYVITVSNMTKQVNVEDFADEDTLADGMGLWIDIGGTTIMPMQSKDGIKFIDRKYTDPLRDNMEGLEFYSRGKYIVAKNGMLLQAVIMPIRFDNEKLPETLNRIAYQLEREIMHEGAENERESACAGEVRDIEG